MSEEKEIKVGIIGGDSGAGMAAARHLAGLGVAAHPVSIAQSVEMDPIGRDPSRAIEVQKKEELKTVDPKLQEAYAKLTDEEKIHLQRGYKTFKKRKGEYRLVDNIPFLTKSQGPKFTPKKKKRKK